MRDSGGTLVTHNAEWTAHPIFLESVVIICESDWSTLLDFGENKDEDFASSMERANWLWHLCGASRTTSVLSDSLCDYIFSPSIQQETGNAGQTEEQSCLILKGGCGILLVCSFFACFSCVLEAVIFAECFPNHTHLHPGVLPHKRDWCRTISMKCLHDQWFQF